MAISVSDFRMAIRIDNSEAKIKFEETKAQVAAVGEEMKKLASAGKKNSDEYKALKQKQDELNKSLAAQRKETGLCSLSYAELRKGAGQLKRAMDKATPGTKEWKELRADFMKTKQRMKELEVQARDTRFSLSKVADGFNKYAAIGAGAIASLTGVAMTARKCVDEFAEMEEAEAQVMKYTGMTKEEVSALNEELKQMDTRTAREKLNALAGDAGRLGITGRKDVLEFVDAADKINVALGEDLGEDAVKNIGKLAQMFGEDEKMGLRGAMLATGSAINEVAQNSSAAEAYLVGFTARVAGAANQAKVAQGDILGYASVLDQNMQQQEMAATAFQTLMMKMYQDPAKFAKIAGQSVEGFTKLIKEDANEALLQLLGTLSKKGGLDQLAPMFKEMGLDGVRASGVISTMAGKVDDIRAAQKLANDAYREGTSILDEYAVQNNTAQAKLDKAKKKFKDVRVELGEQLLPVMKHLVSTGSLTVKGLSAIASILFEYRGAISGAMVVTAGWIAIKKIDVVWTKLQTFWTDKAVVSFKNLKKSMASNIFGIILIGLGAYVGKMIEAKSKQEELNSSISGMKKVNREVAQSFSEQEGKLRALNSIINDNGVSLNERRKALDELKKIVPGYNALIDDEGTLTNNNTEAIKNYLTQLEKEIKLKAAKQELEQLYTQKRTLEKTEGEQSDQYWDTRQQNTLSGYKRDGFTAKVSRFFGTEKEDNALNKLNETRNVLQDVANKIEDVNKEIAHTSIEIEKVEDATKVDGDDGSGGGAGGYTPDDDDKDKKPWITRLKNAESAHQEQLLLLRKNSDKLARTENEYQLNALQNETEFQINRLQIIRHYQSVEKDKKHLAELGKLESDTQANIYDSLKKSEDTRLNLLKEYRDRRTATVKDGEQKVQLEQSKLYEAGELKDKDYENRLKAIELTSLYSRLEIAKDYQNDVAELEFQNGELKTNAVKEAGDSIITLEKEISEKRAEVVRDSTNQIQNFNRQFVKTNVLASTDQQLDALNSFYETQLSLAKENGLETTLLTATYEAAKREIEVNGAEDRAKVVQKYGLETAEETKNLRLKALEEEHQRALLSEEEYQVAKSGIENDYLQEKLEKYEKVFDVISQIAGNASSAMQGFQDAEMKKMSRKYDKQIAAAKKAGKDTTKLEEEKEEAINGVKKKYADKQFAASVLQIISDTAVSVMRSWAMLGPILGPVFGSFAIAQGAAQIAVAKQTRDEAKGLKSGGYSDEYVEGYTRSGNPDDVAGVIPVHKNEFVTNHEGVANPHVRQFLDVFDMAQKSGSIRMINTTQILEQVRTRSGKYSGGYVAEPQSASQSFAGNPSEWTPELRSQIVVLLEKNNDLLGAIRDKDLVVDPRRVRDGIKKVEQLERNVSRG